MHKKFAINKNRRIFAAQMWGSPTLLINLTNLTSDTRKFPRLSGIIFFALHLFFFEKYRRKKSSQTISLYN